ncbi:MAG: hypothetical protein ACK40H_08655 [Sphingomonadaceae bacterium]
MRRLFPVSASALVLVAACAPSPLYVGKARVGTPGEIPRDERGEPIWDMIPPPPAGTRPAEPLPRPAPPPPAGAPQG